VMFLLSSSEAFNLYDSTISANLWVAAEKSGLLRDGWYATGRSQKRDVLEHVEAPIQQDLQKGDGLDFRTSLKTVVQQSRPRYICFEPGRNGEHRLVQNWKQV
jgi:hypothetical protein